MKNQELETQIIDLKKEVTKLSKTKKTYIKKLKAFETKFNLLEDMKR